MQLLAETIFKIYRCAFDDDDDDDDDDVLPVCSIPYLYL